MFQHNSIEQVVFQLLTPEGKDAVRMKATALRKKARQRHEIYGLEVRAHLTVKNAPKARQTLAMA